MQLTRRGILMAPLAAPAVTTEDMPLVPFGRYSVSRLIVGGNPVSGNSHVSAALSAEMRDYFTAANVKKLLRDCEKAGINTWQSRGDRHILRLLNEYRLEGGAIQWIGQTASELADIPRNIREMAAAGAIGIYHHGSKTDALWADGRIGQVREMLKVMRQTGVQVGLGTHIPEVVDHVESEGWDLDFYMTAVYNLARPPELFRDEDREKMLARVRRTSKPCLIFKVYAASRQCDSPARMRAALGLVFRYAKPTDCVVIGMFPKHREQVRENCWLVREALGVG
ncbi:MAG TPA: hypothetical protein VFA33_28070 [Bryobacteraceae bacterium]|nr:hypothetical protein [Bryobacteraceae bacterium]